MDHTTILSNQPVKPNQVKNNINVKKITKL
jgi:hypothetical protein